MDGKFTAPKELPWPKWVCGYPCYHPAKDIKLAVETYER